MPDYNSSYTGVEIDAAVLHHKSIGYMDYSDTGTAQSISAATVTALTNDGNSVHSIHKPSNVTQLWNTTTDQFDWTDLKLGDTVMVRVDISPETLSANTDITVGMRLAVGGSSYTLNFLEEKPFKTATVHSNEIVLMEIFMGDTNTLNNPAEIVVEADKAINISVNGWYIKVN